MLKERTHIARCTFTSSGATSLLYGSSKRSYACTSDVRATCIHTSSHRSETRHTCRQSAPPATQTRTWEVGAPGCCGSREGSGGGAPGPDNSGGGAAAAEAWKPGGRGMWGLRLSYVGRRSLTPGQRNPTPVPAHSRVYHRVASASSLRALIHRPRQREGQRPRQPPVVLELRIMRVAAMPLKGQRRSQKHRNRGAVERTRKRIARETKSSVCFCTNRTPVRNVPIRTCAQDSADRVEVILAPHGGCRGFKGGGSCARWQRTNMRKSAGWRLCQ